MISGQGSTSKGCPFLNELSLCDLWSHKIAWNAQIGFGVLCMKRMCFSLEFCQMWLWIDVTMILNIASIWEPCLESLLVEMTE